MDTTIMGYIGIIGFNIVRMEACHLKAAEGGIRILLIIIIVICIMIIILVIILTIIISDIIIIITYDYYHYYGYYYCPQLVCDAYSR